MKGWLGVVLTAEGRRFARALWKTVRANRDVGGTLDPKTEFVTLTIIRPDGKLLRLHRVPARMVDDAVVHAAHHGETVIIAEEET